jgi:hypothetical protein
MTLSVTNSAEEKVSEIQSLAERAQELNRAVDSWNTWMVWGLAAVAVASVWVFIASRVAIARGKELSEVQDEIIKSKDTELLRDLKAKDEKVAGSEAKAEVARSDAASARLALEKLRATVAWRELTPQQINFISRTLKGQKFKVVISWLNSDPEAAEYASQLERVFRSSGLAVERSEFMAVGRVPTGLMVSGNNDAPDASTLINALKGAGLEASVGSLAPAANLFVGTKPRAK